ncbi:hypothetical protein PENSPDRAFT_304304 [Peniophora sp. CONT]|nr:hypothetical protein PENSPDRAFT_304304 [Peniophora sp. CONT]
MVPTPVHSEVKTDGVHVLFDTQSAQAEHVEDVLGAVRADVLEESQTRHWFAYKLDNTVDSPSTSFGIFNTYADATACDAQKGADMTAKALKENAQLFGEPRIHQVHLLGTKLPDACDTRAPERGAQIIMKARPGFGSRLRAIITGQYRSEIMEEEETPYWFSIEYDDSTFALFAAFYSEADRALHLNGHAAYHLMEDSSLWIQGIKTLKFDIFAAKV